MSSSELDRQAAEVRELAGRMLAEGTASEVSDEAVRRLMTAAAKLYAAKAEEGERPSPFVEDEVTATETVVVVSEMLEAVDVEVFELGMWQVWGSP